MMCKVFVPEWMSKVEKFEDLKCWQAARELVREVYVISEEGKLAKDFDTKSQFKRSALSTMNNIAEGFGRFSKRDFIRFLDFSQSSALEVQSMLYVLEDLSYFPSERLQVIRPKSDETKNLTLALIRYLRNSSLMARTSVH